MLPGQTVADRIQDLAWFTHYAETRDLTYASAGASVVHELKKHVPLGTPEWDQVYALAVRLQDAAWRKSTDTNERTRFLSRLASGQVCAAMLRLEMKTGDLPLTRWQTLTEEALRTVQTTPGLLDYCGRRTLLV